MVKPKRRHAKRELQNPRWASGIVVTVVEGYSLAWRGSRNTLSS